jgi:hypothetical protein
MSGAFESVLDGAAVKIERLRLDGIIRPDPEPFFRYALDAFDYTVEGPFSRSAGFGWVLRDAWSISTVERCIAEVAEEIERCVALLPADVREHPLAPVGVQRLFESMTLSILEGVLPSETDVSQWVVGLYGALREEPSAIQVRVDLGGIAVLASPIEFGDDRVQIRLRAATREDWEVPVLPAAREFAEVRVKRRTSAILELRYRDHDLSRWQRELDRVVTVLRLFGVGAVEYVTVEHGSDSLIDPAGGLWAIESGGPPSRSYALRDGDVDRLRQFWSVMSSAIPESLYWNEVEDAEDVAATFANYRVLLFTSGCGNESFAEVVRALESLLIYKGTKLISRTLQRRTGALLGACGHDSGRVELALRNAYDVRSRYVHGDSLPEELERRIEQEFGGRVALFRLCLDMLRIALVATLAAGLDKRSLIDAVEKELSGDPLPIAHIAAAYAGACQ